MLQLAHTFPYTDLEYHSHLDEAPQAIPSSLATASFCLTLPGKKLHLSSLLQSKKFRNKRNREGALAAFQQLKSAGLGEIQEDERHRGTTTVCSCNVNQTRD